MHGSKIASLTILSLPEAPSKYFYGFGFASGRGSGERWRDNPLLVRIAPYI